MSINVKNNAFKNLTTIGFEMPTWSFEFIPENSSVKPYVETLGYEGLSITQMNDSGTIGIPAIPINSTIPSYLRYNLFKNYSGADLPTATNNRGLRCSSTNSYNFLHDGTGATLFIVIKPNITTFLGVFGNARGSNYSDIGVVLNIDNSPRELRFIINNGNGVSNAARVDYSVPTVNELIVVAATIDSELKLWINGNFEGQDTLISPSSSDATNNLLIFSGISINAMKGYGGCVQAINQVLDTDFIVKYSNYLYNTRS